MIVRKTRLSFAPIQPSESFLGYSDEGPAYHKAGLVAESEEVIVMSNPRRPSTATDGSWVLVDIPGVSQWMSPK